MLRDRFGRFSSLKKELPRLSSQAISYDPVANIRHFPIPMRRFGLNPYQEPLYRIVFAPSRRYLVCGEWPDGSNCAHWVIKHKNLGNLWIMEKWIPGERYAGCTKEQWNES